MLNSKEMLPDEFLLNYYKEATSMLSFIIIHDLSDSKIPANTKRKAVRQLY